MRMIKISLALVFVSTLAWVLLKESWSPTPQSETISDERSKPDRDSISGRSTTAPQPSHVASNTDTSASGADTPLALGDSPPEREFAQITQTDEYRQYMDRQAKGIEFTRQDIDLVLRIAELRGQMIPEIDLEKRTGPQPWDTKGEEMMAWWRKKHEADPQFEYRRKISFYGKVVDELGNPVSDAEIVIGIRALAGDKEVRLKSDLTGRFNIQKEKGKYITVYTYKKTHNKVPQSNGTFEYAEFFSDNFHKPDPNNPVVFVLPRLKP